MTMENGASLDAALNDVFSSGRDRGGNSAPPEVEAAPALEPVAQEVAPPVQEPPKTDPDEPSDVNNGRSVPLNELLGERKKGKAYKSQYEEAEQRAKTFEAQLRTLQEQNQQLIQGFSRPQPAAQQQPQAQPQVQLPDPQQDPFGYLQAAMQMQADELRAQRIDDKLNWSEDRAREKYGDEVVAAAQQAAMRWPPADLERLRSLRDPYGDLVKWYRRQETLKTVGDDPEAYRKRIFEEAQAKVLEDLKAGRLTPGAAASVQQPAPQSFPGTLAAATQQGPTGQITKTLEAATGDVFAPDRRVRGMRR